MNVPPTSRCNTSLSRLPSNLQSSSKLWNEISSAMSSVVSVIASQTDRAKRARERERIAWCEEWEAEQVERARASEESEEEWVCMCVYGESGNVGPGFSVLRATAKWRWRREQRRADLFSWWHWNFWKPVGDRWFREKSLGFEGDIFGIIPVDSFTQEHLK